MKTMKKRIEKVAQTLRPRGLVTIFAHSEEDAQAKVNNYLEQGGNENNLKIMIIEPIKKPPSAGR